MGRRKKNPFVEQLTIDDFASEGKCIGRKDDKAIFVPFTAPGDVVDIRLRKNRKKYAEGVVTKFHKKSDQHIEPFCEHYGVCGGCKWQHVSYETQAEFKQKQVADAFRHLGGFDFPELSPIVPSPKTTQYRNKLEFTFTDSRWLTENEIEEADELERRACGFHVPGFFDKIVDINTCHLMDDVANQIRNKVRDYAIQEAIPFFNIKEKEGFLRNLIVRTANSGDLMVILQVFEDKQEWIKAILELLKKDFPQISSLNYVVNSKGNETFHDLEVICYHGEPFITEKMEELSFRIGPKSFFQPNSEQAYKLYSLTRDFAQLTGEEVVYDLYTGTGTIANFVAKQAKKVVGVEYVEMAIEDAKKNAEFNGIENTSFYAGDMKDVLTADFIEANGKPDVLIIDPPRAGMHPDVVKTVLNTGAKRIVYVSCNPSTQARDIKELVEKYEVKAIQPVDQFPQTPHIENITLLQLTDNG